MLLTLAAKSLSLNSSNQKKKYLVFITKIIQQQQQQRQQQQRHFYRAALSTHYYPRNQQQQNQEQMYYYRFPVFFLTTALAFSSFRPKPPICHAEWRFFSSNKNNNDNNNKADDDTCSAASSTKDNTNCPFYGCPLTPQDVHYNTNEDMKKAMEEMRQEKRSMALKNTKAATQLSTCATESAVTLTLIGYKGGTIEEQINQDRAIVVAPYRIGSSSSSSETSTESEDNDNNNNENDSTANWKQQDRILVGVFDGHAPLGELVSEYAATELPKLLAQKLAKAAATVTENKNNNTSTTTEQEWTQQALEDTFVELDTYAPAEQSGGCTATVILKQGSYIYLANAGDSRSFIVTYRPSTKTATVIAITREDKPNLPDEKARVEAAGGQVYIPIRGTSRVVYHDSTTGAPTGLAMSRSIGDWEAGKLGVIPNPLIQTLNIQEIVQEQIQRDSMASSTGTTTGNTASLVVPAAAAGIHKNNNNNRNDQTDDVYIFGVSATDGLMDYLAASEIARVLAHSLFAEDGAHPVAAVEHLIFAAANAWHQAKQGRYRDDIAIAVSTLRTPPTSSTTTSTTTTKESKSSIGPKQ